MTTRSNGETAPSELGAAFAARELAADQVHARREKVGLVLAGLDAEEVEQLVLPLADQRLGNDQQDALRAFGPALGDHQARLDRLSQADFVSEDAAALAEASEREDHRVDLVGVGIDARLPLRRRVAFPVIRAADPDEVLGEDAPVESVEASDREGARLSWGHEECRPGPSVVLSGWGGVGV